MTKKQVVSVNIFVCLVVVTALCGAGYDSFASRGQSMIGSHPEILAIFAACCLFTELRPLRWLGLEENGQVTASWTFMMALLLVAPPMTAVAIAGTVVLVGEIVSRKPFTKVLFNLGEIVLSLSLAAAVLDVSGQSQALRLYAAPSFVWFAAFLVAGVIVFAVSNALTCTVIALHQALPVNQMLREFGTVNLSTDGVLLCLSPVFVVVSERSIVLVPLVLVAIWTVYRTAELAEVRRNEATHDMLTQLPNRRLFEEHLQRAVLSARRTGQRVAVVLIDLDGFKAINDRLGHDVGDEVLRLVASTLKCSTRPSDTAGRWGGDEFLLVGPVKDHHQAVGLAERVRHLVAEDETIHDDARITVTVSTGVAVARTDEPTKDLVNRASLAMSGSKVGTADACPSEPTGERADPASLAMTSSKA